MRVCADVKWEMGGERRGGEKGERAITGMLPHRHTHTHTHTHTHSHIYTNCEKVLYLNINVHLVFGQ